MRPGIRGGGRIAIDEILHLDECGATGLAHERVLKFDEDERPAAALLERDVDDFRRAHHGFAEPQRRRKLD